jgi:hypothetical protein
MQGDTRGTRKAGRTRHKFCDDKPLKLAVIKVSATIWVTLASLNTASGKPFAVQTGSEKPRGCGSNPAISAVAAFRNVLRVGDDKVPPHKVYFRKRLVTLPPNVLFPAVVGPVRRRRRGRCGQLGRSVQREHEQRS